MSETEIVKAYWRLPENERERIQKQLNQLKRFDREQQMNAYLNEMCIILGSHIELHSRLRVQVDAKKCVAYMLHLKGYTEHEIGKALLKDHSTIHFYIDIMDFYVKKGLKNGATELWERYKKRIQDNGI